MPKSTKATVKRLKERIPTEKEEKRLRAQILELGAILSFHCHVLYLDVCKTGLLASLMTGTGWRKHVPRPAWLADEPTYIHRLIKKDIAEGDDRFKLPGKPAKAQGTRKPRKKVSHA